MCFLVDWKLLRELKERDEEFTAYKICCVTYDGKLLSATYPHLGPDWRKPGYVVASDGPAAFKLTSMERTYAKHGIYAWTRRPSAGDPSLRVVRVLVDPEDILCAGKSAFYGPVLTASMVYVPGEEDAE